MRELEAAAVGLEVASGVEEPAAAADIRKEAAGESGVGGEMRTGRFDPCWILARVRARGAFFGRGEPCPGAKLDLSFSTGQG
jgi:hypothetical protein